MFVRSMFDSRLLRFSLILGVAMAVFVHFTPSFQYVNKAFPWYFYASAVAIYGIHQVFLYSMFVSQMAFFAQISDAKIGGTYMTLLNTVANLGRRAMPASIVHILLLFRVKLVDDHSALRSEVSDMENVLIRWHSMSQRC